MRIQTVGIIPKNSYTYILPHICESQEYGSWWLNEAQPTGENNIEHIEMKRQKWVALEFEMVVYVWMGQCSKCGQEYQSWTYRWWTPEELKQYRFTCAIETANGLRP